MPDCDLCWLLSAGIAVALLLMTYFRSLTHALELAWGVVYMLASLAQPFPWDDTPNDNQSKEYVLYVVITSTIGGCF